jgi:hypothetical protein
LNIISHKMTSPPITDETVMISGSLRALRPLLKFSSAEGASLFLSAYSVMASTAVR